MPKKPMDLKDLASRIGGGVATQPDVGRVTRLLRRLRGKAAWHRRRAVEEALNRGSKGHARRSWEHQAVRNAYLDAAADVKEAFGAP